MNVDFANLPNILCGFGSVESYNSIHKPLLHECIGFLRFKLVLEALPGWQGVITMD